MPRKDNSQKTPMPYLRLGIGDILTYPKYYIYYLQVMYSSFYAKSFINIYVKILDIVFILKYP